MTRGGKRKRKPKGIAPASVELIRSQLNGTDAVTVSALAYSGVRPGEARGLQWGDIGRKTLYIESAIAGGRPRRGLRPTADVRSV